MSLIFDIYRIGNFSEVIVAKHKKTKECFALKILEKKKAAELAKRQHPNVYNEIKMEARVLLERLPPHSKIVTMYHAFQDYNNLYYLMDLHDINKDLWSQIRYNGSMVGCHPSQSKMWSLQLIDALEHMHANGIVHRDLKPENILLNSMNHVVVIDFGTAKDLRKTDLNGPEFVGTPDFMSPEAVTGFSGMPKEKEVTVNGASHCADLWAFGCILYILHTGSTPFWSPSPYLTFLRIKRGLLTRPWGVADESTWDLIEKLMQVAPSKRLGANSYKVEGGKVVVNGGYDILREHKYFSGANNKNHQTTHIMPSLQDLCIRACVELAQKDARDLDICDQHPPGDGSKHDLVRLPPFHKNKILHVLDKAKVFSHGDETRIFQRFFEKDSDIIKAKVRLSSRDFVGLTQMNDDEYKPQSARGSEDPYAKKDDPEPTNLVFLSSPLLLPSSTNTAPDVQKQYNKGWKSCISQINKKRPKAVIVGGNIYSSPKCWKFLSRIRDSIPVVWNDGSCYYTFWLNGFQGIVLSSSEFQKKDSPQMRWLQEQMEQSRMAKHRVFCFCDCDPKNLPTLVLKRLARGRVVALSGLAEEDDYEDDIEYIANEKLEDDSSVKSTDSEEDEDDNTIMKVFGNRANGLRWITIEEMENKWSTSFEAVDC
jgi:serine/threonine protein kinase